MRAIAFSIVLSLLAPQISQAQVSSDQAPETSPVPTDSNKKMAHVMCKNGTAVRTLRIVKKDINCRTLYSKDGVEQVVGKSQSDDTCIGVFEKILGNLEKGNWKCKDVSASRISFAD